jgi:ABC-2 type transport system permease protein
MEAAEYRVNFLVWTLVDLGWTTMDILFFDALVSNIGALGSWGRPQAMVVIGLFRLLLVPIWGWFYQSFSLIPKMLSEGKLDMILTKPVNSQFLVSTRQFSISMLPSVVGGIAFISYGFTLLGNWPSAKELIFFSWLSAVSLVLIYGVYFLTMALSLYVERLNNIHFIFPVLFDASRFPKSIYGPFLQRIFVTLIPVALMITVPIDSLFGGSNLIDLILLHLLAAAFVLGGSFIWNRGLRNYTSASS